MKTLEWSQNRKNRNNRQNPNPAGVTSASPVESSSSGFSAVAGSLKVMTQQIREACRAEGIIDTIAAVEMTGVYHRPVQAALRKAGFDARTVHPFASSHYRKPLHPDLFDDDKLFNKSIAMPIANRFSTAAWPRVAIDACERLASWSPKIS